MTTTPVRAHEGLTAEERATRKDHARHLKPAPGRGSGAVKAAEAERARGSASATVPHRDQLPCRLGHPDLFFAESPADIEEAKALCQGCRIREACLAGALARREPWGVWGGQLLLGGFVAARKRPRGRPPKHPLPQPVAA